MHQLVVERLAVRPAEHVAVDRRDRSTAAAAVLLEHALRVVDQGQGAYPGRGLGLAHGQLVAVDVRPAQRHQFADP
jgi:hypothetical protein